MLVLEVRHPPPQQIRLPCERLRHGVQLGAVFPHLRERPNWTGGGRQRSLTASIAVKSYEALWNSWSILRMRVFTAALLSRAPLPPVGSAADAPQLPAPAPRSDGPAAAIQRTLLGELDCLLEFQPTSSVAAFDALPA
jgi:hypothetical protein